MAATARFAWRAESPPPTGPGRPLRYFPLVLVAALLTACATAEPPAEAEAPPAGDGVAGSTLLSDSGLTQVATRPLNDFNLLNNEIPPVLVAAQKAPYAEPAGHACPAVVTELQALDAALGPDVDAAAPAAAPDPGLVAQAAGAVGQMAVDSVKNTVTSVVDGVVPFRSWVRRLSGAERHSSAVAAAIGAGTLRRAYLKGWAEGTGCALPARRP